MPAPCAMRDPAHCWLCISSHNTARISLQKLKRETQFTVILAVRGRLKPEFGGDPVHAVSEGQKISRFRRFMCWSPDLRHA